MAYIGYFETSGEVQTALNEEKIVNPYVAYIFGDDRIDYNSLEPQEPCYLGEWSEDGEGHYTFQILDAENSAWNDGINIGQLLGVYFEGGQGDVEVKLTYNDNLNVWNIEFQREGASDYPFYNFEEGFDDTWDCYDVVTEESQSSAIINVYYDGDSSFEFYSGPDFPLSMNTIDPECEE